jgi:type I restriction enzyme S subunit
VTTVGDILELSYGKALKESDRDGGDVPVVGSGGVVGGHSSGITDAPTIVVGRKGSIGSVTWIDGSAWPIDTAYFVKPKHEDLDRRWTFWMLKSLRMETMNKSAAVPGLNRDDVYRLDISLPPLTEQRRIAAILDHADALRAKRRQILTHAVALTQSIFSDMFGSEIWSSTLGEIANVQIGPFGSLLHKEDYVSGGVPVINPMHMRNGQLQPDGEFSVTDTKAASLTLYRLQDGDIVLGRRGEMGRAGVAGAQHVGMLCGTGSLILRPRGVDSRFLHAVVTSPRMKAHLERNSLGATLPNLNATIVKASPAPRAPDQAQAEFANVLRAVDESLDAARRAANNDDELFASLESRAFRGEL